MIGKFKVACTGCKKDFRFEAYPEDYTAYESGEPMGAVMPYLSHEEKELIATRICGACWEAGVQSERKPIEIDFESLPF